MQLYIYIYIASKLLSGKTIILFIYKLHGTAKLLSGNTIIIYELSGNCRIII